ncbi:MAG TPA: Fe-S cluster assembly protein SufD [Cyclobacteriaceae bacterium]|nr:Fe-S cluster assembly protein SufD [Cyclobacteriaceae bacterium]
MSTVTAIQHQLIETASQKPKNGFEDLRLPAKDFLETKGLPGNKHEEYKHTPVLRMLDKAFTYNIEKAESKLSGIEKFQIKDLDAHQITFINGYFDAELSNFESAAGLSISTLSAAKTKHAEIVEKYLGKISPSITDAFAALNSLAFEDGIFIHVAAGNVIAKPIMLQYLNDADTEVLSYPRVLIVVEAGGSLNVIEKYNASGSAAHLTNRVMEISVAEEAKIDLVQIQHDDTDSYQINNTTILQKDKSHVNCATFTLSGKLVRNNLNLILDGENCEGHMYGLYLIKANTLVDNHTSVDHKKANSFSNELYKGLIDDKAKGVFNGKIFVRPDAQKTNAFQANNNILLADTALVNTKPQLEIWADDVKCSHGCTIGQLDEEGLFYLRSRGLSKDKAKAILLMAFIGEVMESVKEESVKNYLQELVSERLHQEATWA